MNTQREYGEMTLAELQSRLRGLGYYDGPEGPPWWPTLVALRRFQQDRGLAITGRPDPATADALIDSICF